jgi:hypothetical protein
MDTKVQKKVFYNISDSILFIGIAMRTSEDAMCHGVSA